MGSGADTPPLSPGQRVCEHDFLVEFFVSRALALRQAALAPGRSSRPPHLSVRLGATGAILQTTNLNAHDNHASSRANGAETPRASGMSAALAEPPSHFARNSGVSANDEYCLMRAIKPIELLVPVSYTPCGASTPGLSTRSSSSTLKGELVLR